MKKNYKTLFVAVVTLLSFSCTKESIQEKNSAAEKANAEKTTDAHFIGEHFGGGIIFRLDRTKEHGLIGAIDDLSNSPDRWSNTYVITGATGVEAGTGSKNTRTIIEAQGTRGSYAALGCTRLVAGGYYDWYLPSSGELSYMIYNKDLFGNLSGEYWSSTEDYTNTAYYLSTINHNFPIIDNKLNNHRVRAIRKF